MLNRRLLQSLRNENTQTHTHTHTERHTHTHALSLTQRHSTCDQVFSKPAELHMKRTRSCGLFKAARILTMTLKQVSKPSRLFSQQFSPHSPLPPPKMFLSFSSFQVWSRVESLIRKTRLLSPISSSLQAFHRPLTQSVKPIMIGEVEPSRVYLGCQSKMILVG